MIKNNNRYLVIGQGAIGAKVSAMLAQRGCQVSGMARSDKISTNNVHYIQDDATHVSKEQLQPFSHIAIIVAPDHKKESYQSCYLAIAQHIARLQKDLHALQQVVFISSTGVYGQDEGEWIDEHTMPIMPDRQGAQIILQAEQILRSAFADMLVIIRASGIYGQNRRMRINQVMKDDRAPISKTAWTNRIMDTDLVTIICNVLQLTQAKSLYLATDYRPVTSYELMDWLALALDRSQPIAIDNIKATGKRIHSNIPLDWLHYADWQNGYTYILETRNDPSTAQ